MNNINLFLDTSQSRCNIAIFKNNKIINSVSVPTKNNMTDVVVEKIEHILKKNSVKKSEINALYVTTGPGSFTGVRVSCLIARAWSLIFKTKIFYIDSLSLQVPVGTSGVSILDAKGHRFYVSEYNKKGKMTKKSRLIDQNKYLELVKSGKNIFEDFKKNNIFKNLILNIEKFKLCENINKLKCNYIKESV